MKNIAPDIFRQRLLIEGYYAIDVNEERQGHGKNKIFFLQIIQAEHKLF